MPANTHLSKLSHQINRDCVRFLHEIVEKVRGTNESGGRSPCFQLKLGGYVNISVLRVLLAALFVIWLAGEALWGDTFHPFLRNLLKDDDLIIQVPSQPAQCESGLVTGSDVCQ